MAHMFFTSNCKMEIFREFGLVSDAEYSELVTRVPSEIKRVLIALR